MKCTIIRREVTNSLIAVEVERLGRKVRALPSFYHLRRKASVRSTRRNRRFRDERIINKRSVATLKFSMHRFRAVTCSDTLFLNQL